MKKSAAVTGLMAAVLWLSACGGQSQSSPAKSASQAAAFSPSVSSAATSAASVTPPAKESASPAKSSPAPSMADKVVITTSGEKITLGGGAWPEGFLGKNIPVYKGSGTIVDTMDSVTVVNIEIEKVKKEDFLAYLSQVKKVFHKDIEEMTSNDTLQFSGTSDGGISIDLIYQPDNDGCISIFATQPKEE